MQHEQPFTETHVTLFHRRDGTIRMLRTEAAKAVERDRELSFDPWGLGGGERDPANLIDIPQGWRDLPLPELRRLMSALRLPPGNRGEECGSHSVTIHECLSARARLRWNAAMGQLVR